MGIGINSISAMIDQTNSSAANSKTNALQSKLDGDLSTASDEELMDVWLHTSLIPVTVCAPI